MSQSTDAYTKNVHKPSGSKITLYQLTSTDNGVWYYRFRNPVKPSRYVRKSSRETSRDLAYRIAAEHYEELLVKAKLGLITSKATIDVLVEEFIEGLPKSTHEGIKDALRNYWRPFFKKDDLYNMPDSILRDYVRWRQKPENYIMNRNSRWHTETNQHRKGIHAVAKATIQHEAKYLRYFFRRAAETSMTQKVPDGNIQYENYPHITVQQTNQRRGRFTDQQLDVIQGWRTQFMKDWKKSVAQEKKGEKITHPDFGLHTITRYSNVSFYVLFSLVIQSGLRPVEVKKLIFRDIKLLTEGEHQYCWIEIRREVSKINKRREAICTDMKTTYDRIELFKFEWERFFGRPPEDDDYIFANPRDPLRMREFNRMFRHQLERISKRSGEVVHGNFMEDELFPEAKAWKQNVLYSVRSAYITRAIKNGVPLYHLSRQVGAGETTLEATYNVNTNLIHKEFYTHHILSLRQANKKEG